MRYEAVCCVEHRPLFKSAKQKELIDRDRPAVRLLRSKIRRTVQRFLSARGADVARQVALMRVALGKAEQDDIARILNSLDFSQWSALVTELQPLLEKLVKEGVRAGFGQVGMVSDVNQMLALANDWAIRWSTERSGELITGISETTRNLIRADVARALIEGQSNDVLATVLQRGYAFSRERSEMIARTETAYADVEGNLEAYRRSKVVSRKKWITGANCCDRCDELNGKIVPLNKPFPGGRNGPPLHPNCRCDIVPVLTKKDD